MTAKSFSRGHQCVYTGGAWRYADTGGLIVESRECPRCGRMPTKDGHDACLGRLPGVTSACCGHGVEEPARVFGKRLGCHSLCLEYGYSMGNCCAMCHGLKKEPALIAHAMQDGNTAVVCGGAANWLKAKGLLATGQQAIHGCDWRDV